MPIQTHYHASQGGPLSPLRALVFLGLLLLTVPRCPAAPARPNNGLTQPTAVCPTGKISLARLIDLSAELLSISVAYDSSALERLEVVLRTDESLTDQELWTTTNDLLVGAGFTTVRRGADSGLSVVRLEDAHDAARIETGEASAVSAGFRRVLIAPRFAEPAAIQAAIEPYLSASGTIRMLDDRRLLLSELTSRLEALDQVLERIDAPSSAPSSRVIELRHLGASSAISLAKSVQGGRERIGSPKLAGELLPLPDDRSLMIIALEGDLDRWEAAVRFVDRIEPIETRRYSPRYFGLDEVADLLREVFAPAAGGASARWNLIVDRLTGSLLISATSSDHERIEELLERLAASPPESRHAMRSFVIRNRNVADVRRVLGDILAAGASDAGSRGRSDLEPVGAGQGGREPHPQGRQDTGLGSRPGSSAEVPEDVNMTVDEGTNTLIAIGPPMLLTQIESLLEIIDVRQSQVMLEVLLVSLTEGETQDLGVELSGLIADMGTKVALASLFGLSGVTPSDSVPMPGGGSGGTGVILDPGSFSAVVRALETLNGGRSLSVPRILVNNNESGSFNSVLQIPFASVNASDTVATTSLGGTRDAGTTVSIRPQIAEGDHLLLEYSVSLSAFTGESADPSLGPPRQQNNLSSVATIPDGYTIAVGGIEFTSEADAVSKTPVLGDIPGLGALFRSRSASSSRSRFFVFIRAAVMRHQDFEALRYASDVEAADAGVDDGWPSVAPRVIR